MPLGFSYTNCRESKRDCHNGKEIALVISLEHVLLPEVIDNPEKKRPTHFAKWNNFVRLESTLPISTKR